MTSKRTRLLMCLALQKDGNAEGETESETSGAPSLTTTADDTLRVTGFPWTPPLALSQPPSAVEKCAKWMNAAKCPTPHALRNEQTRQHPSLLYSSSRPPKCDSPEPQTFQSSPVRSTLSRRLVDYSPSSGTTECSSVGGSVSLKRPYITPRKIEGKGTQANVKIVTKPAEEAQSSPLTSHLIPSSYGCASNPPKPATSDFQRLNATEKRKRPLQHISEKSSEAKGAHLGEESDLVSSTESLFNSPQSPLSEVPFLATAVTALLQRSPSQLQSESSVMLETDCDKEKNPEHLPSASTKEKADNCSSRTLGDLIERQKDNKVLPKSKRVKSEFLKNSAKKAFENASGAASSSSAVVIEKVVDFVSQKAMDILPLRTRTSDLPPPCNSFKSLPHTNVSPSVLQKGAHLGGENDLVSSPESPFNLPQSSLSQVPFGVTAVTAQHQGPPSKLLSESSNVVQIDCDTEKNPKLCKASCSDKVAEEHRLISRQEILDSESLSSPAHSLPELNSVFESSASQPARGNLDSTSSSSPASEKRVKTPRQINSNISAKNGPSASTKKKGDKCSSRTLGDRIERQRVIEVLPKSKRVKTEFLRNSTKKAIENASVAASSLSAVAIEKVVDTVSKGAMEILPLRTLSSDLPQPCKSLKSLLNTNVTPTVLRKDDHLSEESYLVSSPESPFSLPQSPLSPLPFVATSDTAQFQRPPSQLQSESSDMLKIHCDTEKNPKLCKASCSDKVAEEHRLISRQEILDSESLSSPAHSLPELNSVFESSASQHARGNLDSISSSSPASEKRVKTPRQINPNISAKNDFSLLRTSAQLKKKGKRRLSGTAVNFIEKERDSTNALNNKQIQREGLEDSANLAVENSSVASSSSSASALLKDALPCAVGIRHSQLSPGNSQLGLGNPRASGQAVQTPLQSILNITADTEKSLTYQQVRSRNLVENAKCLENFKKKPDCSADILLRRTEDHIKSGTGGQTNKKKRDVDLSRKSNLTENKGSKVNPEKVRKQLRYNSDENECPSRIGDHGNSDDDVDGDLLELSSLESSQSSDEENIQASFSTVREIDSSDLDSDDSSNQNGVSESTRKQKEIRKSLRNTGQEYVTLKGKTVSARKKKPPHRCARRRCQDIVTDEIGDSLFAEYWQLGAYNKRCQYVAARVLSAPTKRSRKRDRYSDKSKKFAHTYWLEIKGERWQVCKETFLNTIGETDTFLRFVMIKKFKTVSGFVEDDKRGKKPAKHKLPEEVRLSVLDHINSFPKYESHYCGSQTSQRYLPNSLNITIMYSCYVQSNRPHVSLSTYKRIFKTLKLKFKPPLSDTCAKCDKLNIEMKLATPDICAQKKTELELHLRKAEQAYKLKKRFKDIAATDNSKRVLVFDLEQCLPTPFLSTGAMYYSRQLNTFNLTIYDCTSKITGCYMWHEGEAGRGSNEIASCLLEHFRRSIPDGVQHVYLFSDSCSGQNKNSNVSTMFQVAVSEHSSLLQIDHIFLVPGHTRMECDSKHSVIEKAKKKLLKINVPSEWYDVVEKAGKTDPFNFPDGKFNVIQMNGKFYDFSSLFKKGGCLVKRKKCVNGEDFSFMKSTWFQYRKSSFGKFFVKTSFAEDTFQCITFARKVKTSLSLDLLTSDLHFCHSPVAVSVKKKQDLLKLALPLLETKYHSFYTSLLTDDSVRDTDPDIGCDCGEEGCDHVVESDD